MSNMTMDTGYFAPRMRGQVCDGFKNRSERRAYEYMSNNMCREELRRMYNELKRWCIKVGDPAIARALIGKIYPYVRMNNPLPLTKEKVVEFRSLYDGIRADYLTAHMEDNLNGR